MLYLQVLNFRCSYNSFIVYYFFIVTLYKYSTPSVE